MRVDEALNKIKIYDSSKTVKIISTKSFKEKQEFEINECYVIKQEIDDDRIILTVAYFNI